jgi:hypothetical protein
VWKKKGVFPLARETLQPIVRPSFRTSSLGRGEMSGDASAFSSSWCVKFNTREKQQNFLLASRMRED